MKKVKRLSFLLLTAALLAGIVLPTSAAAVEAVRPRVTMESETWDNQSMDLTKVGTTDWIYLGRAGSDLPPHEDPQPQDRKSDVDGEAVNILDFGYLSETNTWNNFWKDGGTSFSWSDGTNKGKSSGENKYIDMLRKFYGGDYRDDNVGWKLNVPAANEVQTLTFVTGGCWAKIKVSVYVNGEEDAVLSKKVDAGTSGDGHFWKFTVTVAPNTPLEVRGEIRHTETGPDMITLAAAALSRVECDADADYEELLSEQIELAEAWCNEDIASSVQSQLESELEHAEAALESGDETAMYTAWYFLSQATAAAEETPLGGSYADSYAADEMIAFGYEGDADAPIGYMDGTYLLRNNGKKVVTFGVPDVDPDAISWTRAEGYLPSLISKYSKNGLEHQIESFADSVSINNKRYEVVYSRMTTRNTTDDTVKLLPVVSDDLTPLNDAAKSTKVVHPGKTVVREYAIFADRFGNRYSYPANSTLTELGTYTEHYSAMKTFWEDKLSGLTELPEEYAAAYKAACVDMLIAADGYELRAGEIGTDDAFSADQAVEILASLTHMGYVDEFEAFAQALITKAGKDQPEQLAWPFALYLQKTGDLYTVADFYENIKSGARQITSADSEADVLGLCTYRYVVAALYDETGEQQYATERDWADSLLSGQTVPQIWNDGLTGTATLESQAKILKNNTLSPAQRGESARSVLDAFVTELADGTLLVGRGLTDTELSVAVENFLCGNGYRFDHTLESNQSMLAFAVTGEIPEQTVTLAMDVLKDNIAFVTGGSFDRAKGTVTLAKGASSVTVGLGSDESEDLKAAAAVAEAINAIGEVTKNSDSAIQTARKQYDKLSTEQKALVANYDVLTEAEAAYKKLTAGSGSGSSGGSSGGSGSSSSQASQTVTNTDGSKTTIVTDKKTGKVTETTKRSDGTIVVKVTETNGMVTKTITNTDKSQVEICSVPGESHTIIAKDADGKVIAKVVIPAELPAARSFVDIPADYWAKKGVDTVTAMNLFQGTSETIFSPKNYMTRGMLVTVLHRLSGTISPSTSVSFTDMPDGFWCSDAVAWAAENNIVQGYADGSFLPNKMISREMLFAILHRFAGDLGLDTSVDLSALDQYSDSDSIGTWAISDVAWAAANGLVVSQNGILAAGAPVCRDEVAMIFASFVSLLSK